MAGDASAARSVIIHAGMPKTGTTALQSFLSRNYDRLREQGILYPEAGRHDQPAHHALFFSFLGTEPWFPVPDHSRYSISAYVEQIHSEMIKYSCRNIILSSEYLHSRTFDIACLTTIRDSFSWVDRIVIFYALRRPSEFVPSSYAQHIRGLRLGTLSPDLFIQEHERKRSLFYAERIQQFGQVFGQSHVHSVWYHEMRPEVSSPLQRLAGFEVDATWAPPVVDNRRADWTTLALLRLANRLPVGRGKARRAVLALSDRVPERLRRRYGDRLFRPFSDETLRRLDRRYAADGDIDAPSPAALRERGRPDEGSARPRGRGHRLPE